MGILAHSGSCKPCLPNPIHFARPRLFEPPTEHQGAMHGNEVELILNHMGESVGGFGLASHTHRHDVQPIPRPSATFHALEEQPRAGAAPGSDNFVRT